MKNTLNRYHAERIQTTWYIVEYFRKLPRDQGRQPLEQVIIRVFEKWLKNPLNRYHFERIQTTWYVVKYCMKLQRDQGLELIIASTSLLYDCNHSLLKNFMSFPWATELRLRFEPILVFRLKNNQAIVREFLLTEMSQVKGSGDAERLEVLSIPENDGPHDRLDLIYWLISHSQADQSTIQELIPGVYGVLAQLNDHEFDLELGRFWSVLTQSGRISDHPTKAYFVS